MEKEKRGWAASGQHWQENINISDSRRKEIGSGARKSFINVVELSEDFFLLAGRDADPEIAIGTPIEERKNKYKDKLVRF